MEGAQGSGLLDAIRRPYKPGQGVLTRRIAYWSGVLFAVWGARDLWVWLNGFGALREPMLPDTPLSHLPLGGPALAYSVLIAVVVGAAAWLFVAWYLNKAWLADLLITTEAEMKKVSWPGPEEAWSATKVVTVAVGIFTGVLLVFDAAITWLMQLLTGLPL